MKKASVLLVEPQRERQQRFSRCIQTLQHIECLTASDAVRARTLLNQHSFDVLVLGTDAEHLAPGLELLRSSKKLVPDLFVMVLWFTREPPESGSIRAEANTFLSAPFSDAEFNSALLSLMELRRNEAERDLLRRQMERHHSFDNMIGTSPAMRKVFDTVAQIADSGVDVLVVGETGTGKELVAHSLHRRSRRAEKPFVPVDCGAIPENLMEREFFGHERGSFTGADSRRIGLLEFADGGTLFLDELGELPLMLQSKLLRTLQERKIRRVGGVEEIEVDVRVVAATSRNLEAMIREGTFREDLYYRINVVRLDLPPLRERGDDIGLLAEFFAARHSREMGKPVLAIAPEAFQVLSQYPFPGNVRELQNVIRRGIALSRDHYLNVNNLPDDLVARSGQTGPKAGQGFFEQRNQYLAKFEKEYLHDLLRRHHGEVRTACFEAKVPRGTFYRLMKTHNVDPNDFRPGGIHHTST